jgi:hypothetical protein
MIVIPRPEPSPPFSSAELQFYVTAVHFQILKNKGNLGILRISVDGNLLVLNAFYNGYKCIANSELPLFW